MAACDAEKDCISGDSPDLACRCAWFKVRVKHDGFFADAGAIDVAAPNHLNSDQIVAIGVGRSLTEVQTADGKTHWVKETPEQVAETVEG